MTNAGVGGRFPFMTKEWLDKIGTFTVERREILRAGGKPYYRTSSTGIGVLHTVEGSSVDSAWKTLNQSKSAPHFITGERRIIQCRPVSVQAAALRNNPPFYPNVDAQIQIEMADFTLTELWLPGPDVLLPTLNIMAWAALELGIPLQKPAPWPDDLIDLKGEILAGNNSRRKSAAAGLWPKAKGWWMHMEVPAQAPSWHHDCGALRRTQMFRLAQELLDFYGNKLRTSEPKPTEAEVKVLGSFPVLIRGNSGDAVEQLQLDLKAVGLIAPNDVDGKFGPITERAVKQFQSMQKLFPDGMVGIETRRALNKRVNEVIKIR